MLLSKRSKWITAGLLASCVLVAVILPSRPEYILWKFSFEDWQGPEGNLNCQRMHDEIIACGPAAIAPTINAMRQYNIRSDGYNYLPQVLAGLGEPAHQALLRAINVEQNGLVRIKLVLALQSGFEDFSRFNLWLTNTAPDMHSLSVASRFSDDFRSAFPEAPDLLGDMGTNIVTIKVNPDFLKWWSTNKASPTRQHN
jgi:hypothetical protein